MNYEDNISRFIKKKWRYICIYDLYNILLELRLGNNCRTQSILL